MPRLTGIKAISFDADGTLWDFQKVMRHSLGKVMEELERLDPKSATELDIEKMIAIRNRVAEELKGKTTNLEEVRFQAFKRDLEEIGRPNDDLARHLNTVYLQHRFEDIEPYEDALPTLHTLRERYALGLLSNGNSYPERCGFEGLFQSVVFSQYHNVEKPDPEIFRITLRELGCSEAELLHVGDSLENDVEGAHNAGIRCVWLNRDNIENKTDITPDYEIHSMTELVDILL
ncbi:MAG: HAD family hydrolase [Dehalococcoidales bacterium]|nr:MAG: HAD family hydrolase [Dehalococcoidales bacterium]